DAVLAAEDYLREHATRDRRALLVITDGNDNTSTVSKAQFRRAVERSGTSFYAVKLVRQNSAGEEERADGELDHLTMLTGGVVQSASATPGGDTAAREPPHQIRNKSPTAYTPANAALDGTYRAVTVRLKPRGLTARTRRGYWATPLPSPNS